MKGTHKYKKVAYKLKAFCLLRNNNAFYGWKLFAVKSCLRFQAAGLPYLISMEYDNQLLCAETLTQFIYIFPTFALKLPV